MMTALKEKTIVVTGASRGIGVAIALRYAAAGANIVVVTKDSPANIEGAADQILPKVYTGSRWPSIMGDAAYALVLRSSRECTGQFFTDEALLREVGVVDFSPYAVDLDVPLIQPLFIPADNDMTPISQDLFLNLSKERK